MRTIVIDTETAGLDPKDGVVDIAIIEVNQDLEPIATFESLIDPQGPISPSASGVHGITAEDVADAPTLQQFFDICAAKDYCEESLFVVGHNVQFDLRFVAGHLRGPITSVCTLRLARHLYPDAENHKLQTLRYLFGLEAGAAHRAYGDTLLCLNFLRKVSDETGYGIEQLAELSAAPISVDKMPFGKHRGLPLGDLPKQYRNWLLDKADIDDDLRCSLLRFS